MVRIPINANKDLIAKVKDLVFVVCSFTGITELQSLTSFIETSEKVSPLIINSFDH